MVEKRKYARRTTNIPVNYKSKKSLTRVYFKDISCKGAFVLTEESFEAGEEILLNFSVPNVSFPLSILGKITRTSRFAYKNNTCIPSGIGIQFINVSKDHEKAIQYFVNNLGLSSRPELTIRFEPRFCYLHTIDISLGCENHCLYCHFSEANKKENRILHRTPTVSVDITSLYTIKDFPSTIFLSAASDPFSSGNKDLAHEVLSYLLPKGVTFIIVTKELIPQRTLDLIKKYKNQFEGIAVGITNLDPKRNMILEPNCPTSEERLQCLKDLLATGVKNIRMRMDPLFPVIDDNEVNLQSMVEAASKIGVKNITATYIFSFGRYLKRLKNNPFLIESVKRITEKSPMQGGHALTVPLQTKEHTYLKLFELCNARNIHFNTCGCKESRLREKNFSLICRNPDFYNGGLNTK